MPSLALRDTHLHYEQRGDGEPLALLNGVLMTTASWGPMLPSLAERHEVLLHDFRGQLKSRWTTHRLSLDDHVEDFRALLDHLGIASCHLLGTSYGGEVGILFAARYPERVRSLAIVASVAHLEPDLAAKTAAWAEAAASGPRALFRTMLPDTYSPGFRELNPAMLAAAEERLAALPPEFFASFAELVAAFHRLDLRGELGEIRCPTLVVAAELDTLKPPAYSREIAAGIAQARLAVVRHAGHAVVLERPDEVVRLLLDFLSKIDTTSVVSSSA